MLDYLIFSQRSRQEFYEIWQKVSEEKELEGEEAIIGKMMLEHKEYHDTWRRADELANYEYDPETEVNPFLHIAIHATIENQIATSTPNDVRIALESLKAKGESYHDAVHRIGALLMEEIPRMMEHKEAFDEQRYVQNLRKINTI